MDNNLPISSRKKIFSVSRKIHLFWTQKNTFCHLPYKHFATKYLKIALNAITKFLK